MEKYDEELFQEFLAERAKLSTKGKRVNTERAVMMLRNRLSEFFYEGYDANQIIRNSMDHSWLGVFRPKGVEPKQRPLQPKGRLKEMVDTCYKKPPAKKSTEHQRKAMEAIRSVLNEVG